MFSREVSYIITLSIRWFRQTTVAYSRGEPQLVVENAIGSTVTALPCNTSRAHPRYPSSRRHRHVNEGKAEGRGEQGAVSSVRRSENSRSGIERVSDSRWKHRGKIHRKFALINVRCFQWNKEKVWFSSVQKLAKVSKMAWLLKQFVLRYAMLKLEKKRGCETLGIIITVSLTDRIVRSVLVLSCTRSVNWSFETSNPSRFVRRARALLRPHALYVHPVHARLIFFLCFLGCSIRFLTREQSENTYTLT